MLFVFFSGVSKAPGDRGPEIRLLHCDHRRSCDEYYDAGAVQIGMACPMNSVSRCMDKYIDYPLAFGYFFPRRFFSFGTETADF